MKIQKKSGGGCRLGGQGGCKRRFEVFVKILKKSVGVRVDVNEELKFL